MVQFSQMCAIIPIICCIIVLISWHRKNLGVYGLGVAQAPRLVMKSEFTPTRMCTEHMETPSIGEHLLASVMKWSLPTVISTSSRTSLFFYKILHNL